MGELTTQAHSQLADRFRDLNQSPNDKTRAKSSGTEKEKYMQGGAKHTRITCIFEEVSFSLEEFQAEMSWRKQDIEDRVSYWRVPK